MKKIVALMTTILMIFLFPTSVFANAENSITAREVVELACEVFPEYETEIKGKNINNSVSFCKSNTLEIGTFVIEETRQTNDGEVMTYQQDERGYVIITFSYDSTIVSSSYGTGYAHRKSNFFMYCNVSSEILQVNNFEYTHVHNGYDAIGSYGTTSESTATVRYVFGNSHETATMNAYAKYHVSFTVDTVGLSGVVNAYLQIEVGDDLCTCNAVAE